MPAGSLDTGHGRFNVKVPGLVETAEDVYSLPVKQNGEGVVTLADIAEVRRTFKDPSSFTRVNGHPAISINVVKRKGTNIIREQRRRPRGRRTGDQGLGRERSASISCSTSRRTSSRSWGSLQSSILTAIFLVMILVIWALGPKSALLVGISIPTSFMIGFLILSALGMTVNTMVMFGLVLTVGMLVDGAIVMVEYADRKIAEGMPSQEAYIRASKLMFWPIVSSTATTLAAFLPMLLWPGVAGEFMSYLPIMVVIVLSASLLTALVFVPVTGAALSSLFTFVGRNAEVILGVLAGTGVAVAIAFSPLTGALPSPGGMNLAYPLAVIAGIVIGYAVFRLVFPLVALLRDRAARVAKEDSTEARKLSAGETFDVNEVRGLTGLYVRMLAFCAGTPLGTIVTLVGMVVISGGILTYFLANAQGVEFFVDDEPDSAVVTVSARGNMSVYKALDLAGKVEKEVLQVPGIENVVMSVSTGSSSGGSMIGASQDTPPDVIGTLNLELADYCCRRKWEDIAAEIRARTADIPAIRVETRKIEGGPPTGKDVRLQVTSTDYDTLVATVEKVRNHLDAMDGLRDREDSRPLPGIEWQITIDREQAGRFQAGIGSVGSMVQLVTNGVLIGNYRPDDSEDEVDIRVRLPEEERTLDRFDSLRLQTPARPGAPVQLHRPQAAAEGDRNHPPRRALCDGRKGEHHQGADDNHRQRGNAPADGGRQGE